MKQENAIINFQSYLEFENYTKETELMLVNIYNIFINPDNSLKAIEETKFKYSFEKIEFFFRNKLEVIDYIWYKNSLTSTPDMITDHLRDAKGLKLLRNEVFFALLDFFNLYEKFSKQKEYENQKECLELIENKLVIEGIFDMFLQQFLTELKEVLENE